MRLLEETVHLFPTILIDYSKILFELLDAFARDKNIAISSFAGSAYRIVFGIDNCDRKVLLSKLIGFVYERHAQTSTLTDGSGVNATTATTDITTNALMILTEINQKYPAEMKQNSLQVVVSDWQHQRVSPSLSFIASFYLLLFSHSCSAYSTDATNSHSASIAWS